MIWYFLNDVIAWHFSSFRTLLLVGQQGVHVTLTESCRSNFHKPDARQNGSRHCQMLPTSNLYCFAHLRSSITDACTPKSVAFTCNTSLLRWWNTHSLYSCSTVIAYFSENKIYMQSKLRDWRISHIPTLLINWTPDSNIIFISCFTGPAVWNALSAELRSIKSKDTFKRRLKTHYFKLAF